VATGVVGSCGSGIINAGKRETWLRCHQTFEGRSLSKTRPPYTEKVSIIIVHEAMLPNAFTHPDVGRPLTGVIFGSELIGT
jgi:hypothetical protein